jgi:hypothetical protein
MPDRQTQAASNLISIRIVLPVSLRRAVMKYYRCYLLDAKSHIAKAVILKGADDDDAKRQSRFVLDTNAGFYRGVEVWDCARWVYSYPSEARPSQEGVRRRGDAAERDSVIADALSEQIAKDRRTRLGFDDVKTARLREMRLEVQAAAGKLYRRRRRRRHVDEQHVVADRKAEKTNR